MADFETGLVLGDRFEINGVLGRGGMATVYLATDRLRKTQVALKVLHAHLSETPSMRDRLRREVQAASRVRHPGALVAFELHEFEGRLALSMPVHPGQTLVDWLETHPPLTADALRSLGAELASVLAEAHRQGIVHRDVTPSNVMVDAALRPVLTDFGLARLEDIRSATATGVVGTCGYSAPEVYQGDRADPRSDLYSLGAVLYLAATGKPPFKAPTPMGVLQRQLEESSTPLATLRPDLPQDLIQCLEAMIAKDPDKRPQGALEVARKLTEGLSQPATGPARATTPSLGTTARADSPRRSVAEAEAAPSASGSEEPPPVRWNPRPLPAGRYTLVLTEPRHEFRRRNRVRRHRQRRALASTRKLAPRVETALKVAEEVRTGLRTFFDLPDLEGAEHALARAVAREAGLPDDALLVPDALLQRQFRLVESFDKDAAQRLEQTAIQLGFRTELLEAGSTERRVQPWTMPVPLPALALLFLVALMAREPVNIIAALATAVTVIMTTFYGFRRPASEKSAMTHLPLAFSHQLHPLLAEKYRHLPLPEPLTGTAAPYEASPIVLEASIPLPPAPSEVQMRPPTPAPQPTIAPSGGTAPTVPQPNSAEARITQLVQRVTDMLDLYDRALEQRSVEIADVILMDLRKTSRGLRDQVRRLGEEAIAVQRFLAGRDAPEISAATVRLEARLQRLKTLHSAGNPVDAREVLELERALQTRQQHLEETERLEARSTALSARLLEIATAVGDARRLLLQKGWEASTPNLLHRLHQQSSETAELLEGKETGASSGSVRLAREEAGSEEDELSRQRRILAEAAGKVRG